MIKRVMALAMILVASGAQAESVSMTGKFAAKNRDVAILHSIAVDRFSGRDGPQLSLAIERALAGPDNGAPPHFNVVAAGPRGGSNGADGLVTGAVSTGVDESSYREKRKKCVEKADGKCVRHEQREIECARRTIELRADIRVAREDGRILYSRPISQDDERSWCDDEGSPETVESVVQGMIRTVANEFRRDVAPHIDRYSIRFRESTKAMPKPLATGFKTAVKQSQRDLKGACASWEDLDRQLPEHPSILFDLGLCAEAIGDYGRAQQFYGRARPLLGRGSEAATGYDRIGQLTAAREDDDARDGPR